MSTTFRMVFNDSNFMCLYGFPWLNLLDCKPFIVLGLFSELKAFDLFLHTSRVSVNRNNTKWSPRPLRPSVSSITSHLATNDLCEETKCGGQLSISLKISNIANWRSVFLLSSFMYVMTFLIQLIEDSSAL